MDNFARMQFLASIFPADLSNTDIGFQHGQTFVTY